MNEAAENVMPSADGRDPRGRLCVGGGTCSGGQSGTCRELPEPSEEERWAGNPVWGRCVPLFPARMLCSARQGSMAWLLAENRVPTGALSLGSWTCPEVYECFRQQAEQRFLELMKGTLQAQTADLEHPTPGGGVSAVTPASSLSPGLHGA